MSSAVKTPLTILRRRTEFLAIAKTGRKWVAPGLILQMSTHTHEDAGVVRYGLTASSKIGNAVIRNRARRRLRALVAGLFPFHAAQGRDYVVIARAVTPKRESAELKQDLMTALKKLGAWRE